MFNKYLGIVENRTFKLKTGSLNSGSVLYWMSRDQRTNDNWALIQSYNESLKRKTQLWVVFALSKNYTSANLRHYDFMINGLKEVSENLSKLNIHFRILFGTPTETISEFINLGEFSVVYTDFDPLKIKREWKKEISGKINATIYEVDAHNIVPCRVTSDKLEFAAYTIRNKINSKLNEYLTEFPKLLPHEFNTNVENIFPEISLNYLDNIPVTTKFRPGENAAMFQLSDFLNNRLVKYSKYRNFPEMDFQSDLSPYLHFGQISAQRIALEVNKIEINSQYKESFLEELIVRKELSDNFCFYNTNYDNFEGFPDWAKKTLNDHISDKREYLYTLEQLELALTHDKYWNAAQNEMVKSGKMHGYMRMYWAKKILEWTKSHIEAQQIAIYLNDKYQLDGRDPNGYTGIAWSIGGVHDRAWSERKIFGKIRYMNEAGLNRKYDMNKYIAKVNKL